VAKFPLSVSMLTQVGGNSLQVLARMLIQLQTLFYATTRILRR
jgi:hypothetical protein